MHQSLKTLTTSRKINPIQLRKDLPYARLISNRTSGPTYASGPEIAAADGTVVGSRLAGEVVWFEAAVGLSVCESAGGLDEGGLTAWDEDGL